MVTLIAHFYNEERLLPFWLTHHTKIFQDGILIDYSSTDRSVNVIKKLAPHWKVVQSRNKDFDALQVDQEVMEYEREIVGWKVCLNITEFAICSHLTENLHGKSLRFEGYEIVDAVHEKNFDPNPNRLLIRQRHFGRREPLRDRLIHCLEYANYTGGRHWSRFHNESPYLKDGIIFWYSLSPMTIQLERKLQISDRIPESDKKKGLGIQHYNLTRDMVEERWREQSKVVKNLMLETKIASSIKEYLRQ